MKLLSALFKKEPKVVEKRKIWYIIPAAIVALAFIFGGIWYAVFGSAFNLSMDFAGGYTITVNLSTKLTEDTFPQYERQIIEIAENLADEEGNTYGLEIRARDIIHQGEGADASIYIRYRALRESRNNDQLMSEVNERFREELEEKLFVFLPAVTFNQQESSFTAVYTDTIKRFFENVQGEKTDIQQELIAAALTDDEIAITDIAVSEDGKTLTVSVTGATAEMTEKIIARFTIPDTHGGQATEGDSTEAVISSELLINSFLALALALTLMLVYIAFRFEVAMGVSTILSLLHDLLVMFALMVIFHVEIGATFIAALITLLGYSINNTIIMFDRVRDRLKPLGGKPYDPNKIANQSVRAVLVRSLAASLTTLLPIAVIALIGVPSIQVFALPIIFGLIAGTFSSLTILPSIWSTIKRRRFKKLNAKNALLSDDSAEPVVLQTPIT
ncbi:MAG: protein translocase subunit SecF [Firmicutes bacterium]|nr:protein translocase subunit SecF [Bacillota bacterium]